MTALTIGAFVLTGCATSQADRIGTDTSDACFQYRKALDATGDFFAEDMIKGAVIGAIGGALIGGLLGGGRGAVAGALAGGALGAAGGYWSSKQQQAADKAVLYNTVYSDIEREAFKVNEAQFAFDKLMDCRRQQGKQIRADLAAKRITRPEAEARMAALNEKVQGDIRLAQMIDENINKRTDEFIVANEQINPGSTERVKQVAVQRAQRPAAQKQAAAPSGSANLPETQAAKKAEQATVSLVENKQRYAQSVQTAAANPSAITGGLEAAG